MVRRVHSAAVLGHWLDSFLQSSSMSADQQLDSMHGKQFSYVLPLSISLMLLQGRPAGPAASLQTCGLDCQAGGVGALNMRALAVKDPNDGCGLITCTVKKCCKVA